jgi:hypothetical protein
MRRTAIVFTFLLGFPLIAAADGCDVCHPRIICNPECEVSAYCKAAGFGTGRDCEVIDGVCYEGGGFCQWTELGRDADAGNLIARLTGISNACCLEAGI